MFRLIWRLLTGSVFSHSSFQKQDEPQCYLSMREWADLPSYHPPADKCRS